MREVLLNMIYFLSLSLHPARYHHLKRAARLRTPVRSRFCNIQPSAPRTDSIAQPNPSDNSLGYFHSVRRADEMNAYFLGKATA